MSLTFNELRDANVTRCEEVFHDLDSWSPTDWATAMAGECGEACNEVKKLRRLDGADSESDTPEERERLRVAIGKEIADMIIYADLLAARLGIDLDEFVTAKFNEVSKKRRSTVILPLESTLVNKAQLVVKSVLKGERIGFDNGLHYAAESIKTKAQLTEDSALIQFAEKAATNFYEAIAQRATERGERSA